MLTGDTSPLGINISHVWSQLRSNFYLLSFAELEEILIRC